MNRRLVLQAAIAAGLALANAAWAAPATIPAGQQLRTYSSIEFIPDEGEYVGFEITIVPYTGGTSVLLRMAGGRIDAPRLYEALPREHGWVVQVPADSDIPGEWTLTRTRQGLTARSPNGNVWKLKRLR